VKIVVTGARDLHPKHRRDIRRALERWAFNQRPQDVTVIHGGAEGADRMAGVIAHELGLKVDVHYADWKTHGKAAGPIRNREMLEEEPDVVLAFPGPRSVGTRNCIAQARQRGLLVEVEECDG
jgi:alpha-beta hydrolase superfamily lysophospholipase